ncbi:hypothetical protein BASA60_007561 [Batrachochytrium salamandrivorans]|nr:hypothetical protein BASA60_007561 [Batrachochytrium salamandrivorans]
MADLDDEDDALLYGSEKQPQDSSLEENNESLSVNHPNPPNDVDPEADAERDESEESDDDDDIEIVLSAPGEAAATGLHPASSSNTAGSTAAASSLGATPAIPKAVIKTPIGLPIPRQDSTAAIAAPAAASGRPAIDIDAVGQYEGKDILDVDVDQFEEKPWKKPGADITDFFNYGFNENTWKTYCNKQKLMREEMQLQKRLNPYELPMDADYGFDMQVFAAQQRMLGNPISTYPTGKYQRLPPANYGADGSGRSSSVIGKRPRDEDDSVKVLGEQSGDLDLPQSNDMFPSSRGFPPTELQSQLPQMNMGFQPPPGMYGDMIRQFPGNPDVRNMPQHLGFDPYSQGPRGNMSRMDQPIMPRPLDGSQMMFDFDPRAAPMGFDPRAFPGRVSDPTNRGGQSSPSGDHDRDGRDKERDRDRDRTRDRDRERGRGRGRERDYDRDYDRDREKERDRYMMEVSF